MKKSALILFASVIGMLGSSCMGPEGPVGPPGYTAEAEVFEVNASFGPGNFYSQTYGLFPNILPSDNILVYELYSVDQGFDTWALLPQVYYFNQGQAQYNYHFSYDQFTLFIDADFDLNLLPPSFIQNKIFRIVVIPGYFSGRYRINFNDYHQVEQAFNLKGKPIKRL